MASPGAGSKEHNKYGQEIIYYLGVSQGGVGGNKDCYPLEANIKPFNDKQCSYMKYHGNMM